MVTSSRRYLVILDGKPGETRITSADAAQQVNACTAAWWHKPLSSDGADQNNIVE